MMIIIVFAMFFSNSYPRVTMNFPFKFPDPDSDTAELPNLLFTLLPRVEQF